MKRTELRRGKPLRRMSAKRKAALKVRIKPGPACELCDLLDGVASFGEFSRLAADWQWRVREPHHVHNAPRSRWDHPGNVVTVCRVVHAWHHECFSRAGRMVATEALCRAGRFDRELTRSVVGYDPIAFIEADYQAGIFESDPVLDGLCLLLLERFG